MFGCPILFHFILEIGPLPEVQLENQLRYLSCMLRERVLGSPMPVDGYFFVEVVQL